MASLHTVAEDTKKTLRFGAIAIVGLVLAIFVLKFGVYLKNRLFPTPPPPPTVTFGKLLPIPFDNTKSQKLTYVLNTVSGGLPILPDRATVFRIIQPQPSLLNLDRAKQEAGNVGFDKPPIPLSETLYKWSDDSSLLRKLTFDIQSGDYTLTSNYLTNSQVASSSAPSAGQAVISAEAFLSSLSSADDIDSNKTTTKTLSISNGVQTVASSLSLAQAQQVDFFQKDVEDLPIFYPNPPSSTMEFVISGETYQNRTFNATFVHHSLSEASATYPIKTAQEAFSDLKNGNAFIPYQVASSEAAIRNIVLGYYMGREKQYYLMPIVVFEGDNNFYAYVSAVKANWIGK